MEETFPPEYKPKLGFLSTERGIKIVKDTFEEKLADKLSLTRVSSPRFLMVGTGLQDDLAGTQVPVSFRTTFLSSPVEIVHSLAKWKRSALQKYGFKCGTGLYTDMDAIRKDEIVSPIHSIYVDQWDWERVISEEDRTIDFLKETVEKIYEAILETGDVVSTIFPELKTSFSKSIKFVTTDELERRWPTLKPKEREDKIAKELGAVFVMGIGYKLKSGEPHDLRAADYDDWKLCGDIVVWDRTRKKSLELSSMGIRVDKDSLEKQLEEMKQSYKKDLDFHKGILEDRIPLTIGGGIGKSRLCMFLLKKAHIGEVHSSVWPQEVEKDFEERGIQLL